MIRREEKDIPVRKIQWVGVGLITLLLLIGIALMFYQNYLVKDFHLTESWPRLTPRSQKEFESGQIREEEHAKQAQNLRSYQGLNEAGPWVQVPIERAMQYLLERKSTDPVILFSDSKGGAK